VRIDCCEVIKKLISELVACIGKIHTKFWWGKTERYSLKDYAKDGTIKVRGS
jgi:hypothetical protein